MRIYIVYMRLGAFVVCICSFIHRCVYLCLIWQSIDRACQAVRAGISDAKSRDRYRWQVMTKRRDGCDRYRWQVSRTGGCMSRDAWQVVILCIRCEPNRSVPVASDRYRWQLVYCQAVIMPLHASYMSHVASVILSCSFIHPSRRVRVSYMATY